MNRGDFQENKVLFNEIAKQFAWKPYSALEPLCNIRASSSRTAMYIVQMLSLWKRYYQYCYGSAGIIVGFSALNGI